MPLALVFIGGALLVSAIRGTQGTLFSLLSQDIKGYLKWAAAIVAVGLLGYIPDFEGPARALLALVLIVIVLANKGLFTKIQQDFANPPAATPATSPAQGVTFGPVPVQLQGGSSGGGIGGLLGQAAGAVAGGGSSGIYATGTALAGTGGF